MTRKLTLTAVLEALWILYGPKTKETSWIDYEQEEHQRFIVLPIDQQISFWQDYQQQCLFEEINIITAKSNI